MRGFNAYGTQLGRVIEREQAAEELQHKQEALRQREKLAAMGSLLASVAHELNNPLAVISLQADLLREEAAGSRGGTRRGDYPGPHAVSGWCAIS